MKRSDSDQDTLFTLPPQSSTSNTPGLGPLAHEMRPQKIADMVGQSHFLNAGFRRLVESDRWSGFIFWGPPGTGKTTLATVIASITRRPFSMLSAVTSGVKDIREVLEASKNEVRGGRAAHILFIDEVHRLNKAQQDVLLPYLEDGSARFIGATTENPSFEINNAISSRCVIYHFNPLSPEELSILVKRAASRFPQVTDDIQKKITECSLGDARRALNLLEHFGLSVSSESTVTLEDFEKFAHSQALYYDKKSEAHYDTISAFIKSVRGSDPDAALYYLARMLEAGEDPLFVARRLIILASEDVGNASPMGLVVATNAFTATHAVGMPEARIILAQATTYLACCEKSNASYLGIEQAREIVRKTGNLEIPYNIRNAPTTQMKEWGYGEGYEYPHNHEQGWVQAQYLPDAIKDKRFYVPSENGTEKNIQVFLKKRGK
jgi:putative ATPase